MKANSSRVTIHMVASLDGFVADKNNDISWIQSTDDYRKGESLTEEDIANYLKSIDCYVMGSRTFEHAQNIGWPYGDKPVFVFTNRPLRTDNKYISFVSGNLAEILKEKLMPKYSNIWVVGGSEITKAFLRQDLVDEIVITFMPIILGDGLLFFDYIGRKVPLHLKDVTAYKDGMVEITYKVKRKEEL